MKKVYCIHIIKYLLFSFVIMFTSCESDNLSLIFQNPEKDWSGLLSIEISQKNVTIPKDGFTMQFTARGSFKNRGSEDITSKVIWSSTNTDIATINSDGKATSISSGNTIIQAKINRIYTDTTLNIIDEKPESILVSPVNHTTTVASTLQYKATGLFPDGSETDYTELVTWSSLNTAFATINDLPGSKGLATAVSIGKTKITASFGPLSRGTSLTVNPRILVGIDVTPKDHSIPLGGTLQYKTTALYKNGTTEDITGMATWSSSNPAIASINNIAPSKGFASGLDEGTTDIEASIDLFVGNTSLTVTTKEVVAIDINPKNASVAMGNSLQYTAIATYTDDSMEDITNNVTWNVINPTIASISNLAGSNGLATGLAEGITDIEASIDLVVASTSLTVGTKELDEIDINPKNASVPLANTLQYNATAIYSDGSTEDISDTVTWSSINTYIASISNLAGSKGLAKGESLGHTYIQATLDSVTSKTRIEVTLAELVSIDVTPKNQTIHLGDTLQYKATGTYTDGSTSDVTESMTWTSSNHAIASINNTSGSKGLATGLGVGTTDIQANIGTIFNSTKLTVTDLWAPVLNNLSIGSFDANSILLDQPTLSVPGNPTPTIIAYIGLEGTISVTGNSVSNSTEGPVDVSSGGYDFQSLIPNTNYCIIVIAENIMGYSVMQIVQQTPVMPTVDIDVTIRDFSKAHPDFQAYYTGLALGLVKNKLGSDQKPIFKSSTASNTGKVGITDEKSFNQWYKTIPGVNYEFHRTLTFAYNHPYFIYNNPSYFPVSNTDGWGAEGNPKNFYLTSEIHVEFKYIGGEEIIFSGDDDLWIFIDGQLVIDLGGVHPPLSGSAQLDDMGLIPGNLYRMDLYHAERHTTQSDFTVITDINLLNSRSGKRLIE